MIVCCFFVFFLNVRNVPFDFPPKSSSELRLQTNTCFGDGDVPLQPVTPAVGVCSITFVFVSFIINSAACLQGGSLEARRHSDSWLDVREMTRAPAPAPYGRSSPPRRSLFR